jgi:acetyl esterase
MVALGDPPIAESTAQAARALRISRRRPSSEPIHEFRDLDAGGVAARLFRPNGDAGLGLLVYFHGGGWVLSDVDSHDNLCRILANESGNAVLSVEYRLAPEHPFPAGLNDAVGTLVWVSQNAASLGCDPDRLAVGGDSAGANLATVAAQLSDIAIRFQLLIYPVTDARMVTRSYQAFRDGPFLTAAGMKWFIDHYLSGGEGSADDPRVSPLLADPEVLKQSPPTAVITAGYDPLRDEGEQYASRLADLGVPVSQVRYSGMFHGFCSQSDFLDDAKAALAHCGSLLRSALARG